VQERTQLLPCRYIETRTATAPIEIISPRHRHPGQGPGLKAIAKMVRKVEAGENHARIRV
jgi:hypothetical protein